jgi:hypothetical protein
MVGEPGRNSQTKSKWINRSKPFKIVQFKIIKAGGLDPFMKGCTRAQRVRAPVAHLFQLQLGFLGCRIWVSMRCTPYEHAYSLSSFSGVRQSLLPFPHQSFFHNASNLGSKSPTQRFLSCRCVPPRGECQNHHISAVVGGDWPVLGVT